MEYKAIAKYVRISPQKVRKIIAVVKGKPVGDAIAVLNFMPQKAAAITAKVISSALANAEQKDADVDSLIILNITADKGPTLKRFRARARGRGNRILKPTCHISVALLSIDD